MTEGFGEEKIRAFVAVELPEAVKAELSRLRAKLRRSHDFVKWVEPSGMHLTLKFLGNVPRRQVELIAGAMREASSGIGTFVLETASLGTFPNLRQPRVLWVAIAGDSDKLVLLQSRLEKALAPLGFAPEARPFTAHLTLARLRDNASGQEKRSFGEDVGGTSWETRLKIPVASYSLMRSELTPGGAVYTRLAEVGLASGGA